MPEEVEEPRQGTERCSSTPNGLALTRNRSHEHDDSTACSQDEPAQKRIRLSQLDEDEVAGDTENQQASEDLERHPVKNWVVNDRWPKSWRRGPVIMLPPTDTSDSSYKWDHIEALVALARNGIHMDDPKNPKLIQRSSEELCESYRHGDHIPKWPPSYPLDKVFAILLRVGECSSQARIQRDIMPLVVPSAENVFHCDEPIQGNWIGDELNAEWTMCAVMGINRPKPSYTAGLLLNAFTRDEREKLSYYSSPRRPFLFTPELSFPFLICEARSKDESLGDADIENLHSAAIAIRAIIELYREAFGESDPDRVSELHGQVLVFTVSHNHAEAYLYGHYATISDDVPGKLEFYRHVINCFTLRNRDGQGRFGFGSYNFVRNVYEKFAPEHRNRIKDAAAHLKPPGPRMERSLSASSSAIEEGDSQATDAAPAQDIAGLENQSLSPTEAMQQENTWLRALVDRIQRQMQASEQEHQRWLEEHQQKQQQLDEEQQRLEQQLQQLEGQRGEQTSKLQDLEAKQTEQDKAQAQAQLEQLRADMEAYKDMIKTLKQQISSSK